MSKWFMKKETYDFLADKMNLPPMAELPKNTTVTQYVEKKGILEQAQAIFGGKILNKKISLVTVRGQTVGRLETEGDESVLIKKVKKSKHLFRKIEPDGAWGLDNSMFNKLPDKCKIKIIDLESNIIYFAVKEDFDKEVGKAKFLNFGSHGLQRFLPLQYWEKIINN